MLKDNLGLSELSLSRPDDLELPEPPTENDAMDEKHHRSVSTGTYRIRGVSRDLHRAARLRAASQGTTLRRVVLQALQAYSAGTWTPPDEPPGSRTNGI
jgi:hypothetical protein